MQGVGGYFCGTRVAVVVAGSELGREADHGKIGMYDMAEG